MKRILTLLALLVAICTSQAQHTAYALFHNPADEYRPFVRWWWNGDKVDSAEIVRELRVLKDAGIGGVEINPIEFPSKRCDDLGKPSLVWLSDEWIAALKVALEEAHRLGMQCDLLVGSGWPFGRENIPMDQRAQVMLTYAVELNGSEPYITTRQAIFDAVDPKVTERNNDRRFSLEGLWLAPDSITDLLQVEPLPLPQGDTIVVAHSASMEKRYLYALVRCTSFASVINGAPGASGAMIDHMNPNAVLDYLEYMRVALEKKLGKMNRWLRAYFVDSMELEGSNWTTDFAEEFERRNGYDVMPYLPLILFKVGRLGDVESYRYGAGKSPEVMRQLERVRLDFETTKAQLLHERYTHTFLEWCHRQGVKSRAQAYGRGFYPLESSKGYDIPEGESWTTNYLRHRVGEEMPNDDYRRGRAYTMINKYVSSAAHQSGRRIVSAEEMTNTYRLFETTLELLKVGSDMSAASGVTHSVWHGFNYSPPEAGFPGWVQYGSYLNEHNTWWPHFHLLNDYRARMSAVLQNADLQADMAILLPTRRLWAEYGVQTEPFPNYPKGSPYEVPQLLWEAIHKNGGNCDYVNAPDDRYAVLIEIGDSTISFTREGKRVEVLMPADWNFLTWYQDVQQQLRLPHAVSITEADPFLLQNHYRNDEGEDIFLFVNASIKDCRATHIAFPKRMTKGRAVWKMDPSTGERTPLLCWKHQYYLHLGRSESSIIVLTKDGLREYQEMQRQEERSRRQSHGYIDEICSRESISSFELTMHHAITDWDTTFVITTEQDLMQTLLKDFAGTMVYRAQFHLDSNQLFLIKARIPADHICELYVNGHLCDTRWFGDSKMTIDPSALHPGTNTIEIKLTTTLTNYVHTLVDDKVIQHFVIKRNVPTSPLGLQGMVSLY